MEINEFYERYYEFTEFRRSYPLPKKVLNVCDEFKDSDSFNVIEKIVNKYDQPEILDVGGGHRKLNNMIESFNISYNYKSVDKSKNVKHDYQDINDIKKSKFDIIFMFELIEHLSFQDGLSYLSKVFDLLKNNGVFIISTPNAHHINQLWKSNVTHIQQYPGSDLCAILRMIGFSDDIKMYRSFIKSRKTGLKKYIKFKLHVLITKILGVDYAHGIMVIAKK